MLFPTAPQTDEIRIRSAGREPITGKGAVYTLQTWQRTRHQVLESPLTLSGAWPRTAKGVRQGRTGKKKFKNLSPVRQKGKGVTSSSSLRGTKWRDYKRSEAEFKKTTLNTRGDFDRAT